MEAKKSTLLLLIGFLMAMATTAHSQDISNASNRGKISINDNLLIAGESISEDERNTKQNITGEMEAYQWPMRGFITFKSSEVILEGMTLTTYDHNGKTIPVVSKSSGKKITIEIASLDVGSYLLLMEDSKNQRIAKFKFMKKG